MNFSSIFVALPCHSMIFFEFSNINAILGDEVAKHDNGRRGEKTGTENRNYFGPTKAAVSLIFLIK